MKNLFKNHEEQPAPEMWEKVMSDVKHHNAVVRAGKIGVAASLLVVGGVVAFMLLNNTSGAPSQADVQVAQATAVETVSATHANDVATDAEILPAEEKQQSAKAVANMPEGKKRSETATATAETAPQVSAATPEKSSVAANTEKHVAPATVAEQPQKVVNTVSNSTVAATTTTTASAPVQPVQPANNNKIKAGTNPDSLSTPTTEEIKFVMPTAIAPDQGDNNKFCVVCNHPELLKNYELNIFTRNGLQVYHTKTITECWDGKYKGRIQPMGAYAYVLIYTTLSGDKKVEKGTVTIVR